MLGPIVRKELLQVRRDRRMFPIIFVAPVLQLIILGYAATFDVKNVRTVVCDGDRTQESRDYVASYFAGSSFQKVGDLERCRDADGYLDRGDADVAVIVPSGFGKAVASGENTAVQVLVNGTDANAGGVGLGYIGAINGTYSTGIMVERLRKAGSVSVAIVGLQDRVLYNPELTSRNFMVPAILALLLMLVSTMLTALAVVKEKETGTMEQLIVTPARSYQIIIGKLLPFILLSLVDVLLVTSVAVFWFHVPFRGSFLLLVGLSLPFLMNTLGLGLLVSTVSSTQQQAMMTVMFGIMLPFMYFSGFVFPIENMPRVIQLVTYAVPLRYYLEIVRGIFLKGVGLSVLWKQGAILTGMGLFILGLAIARFRKQL
jgi:ABC-2 type transport system permease protein